MTTTTTASVANTIWGQISLSTKMACGMREMTFTANSLTAKVGKASTWVTVTLTPSDEYRVELVKMGRSNFAKGVFGELKTVKAADGVYCDNLSEVIYDFVNR